VGLPGSCSGGRRSCRAGRPPYRLPSQRRGPLPSCEAADGFQCRTFPERVRMLVYSLRLPRVARAGRCG
jgi:hypothetical protein